MGVFEFERIHKFEGDLYCVECGFHEDDEIHDWEDDEEWERDGELN